MKKAAILLLVSIIFLNAIAAIPFNHILAYANSGRKIDLFTQKQPFDGKGLNKSSDSFQPQEEVILYALVTYNDAPISNKLVAFQVNGPSPPTVKDPITLILTSATNESGIATISFRIPTPQKGYEGMVIGEWFAIATVDIAGIVVCDTLTFKVDWGVKINCINILNDKLEPQNMFLRRSIVMFDLTVENTGLTTKTATLCIDVTDAAGYPIIHAELDDQLLQPGENKVRISSQIPVQARIGKAEVFAGAYTSPPSIGGSPYSPPANVSFVIITRDIAVTSISLSKTIAKIGDQVKIYVTVKNKGNQTESFPLSVFYNQTLIQKKTVDALEPGAEAETQFYWNTSGVNEGHYIIRAVADPVEGEIEVEDNMLADGIIYIVSRLPQVVHDIAVTYLRAQPSEVTIGTPIQITVEVKNLGTVPESFNVTLFSNNFPITTLNVGFLAPGVAKNLTYLWDTSSVLEGNYTIKAYATPVAGEQNIANNLFVDGAVWVKAYPIPIKRHDVAVTALHISEHSVYQGDRVDISVYVSNLGDFNETFDLGVYANMSKVWSFRIEDLKAGSSRVLSFTIDTARLAVGNYTVWAQADYVAGELNIENNIFVDGTLVVQSPPIHYVHDVAVTSVRPSTHVVLIGQKLNITVAVKNYGNATESFNLTLFYDSNPIKRVQVYSLYPSQERTFQIEWDTSNVEEGTYTLKAYAEPVTGEVNVDNNILVDGSISVLKPSPTVTRDVAVVWMLAEPVEVEVGKTIMIKVTVANFGNVPEDFNVTIYYDTKKIESVSVALLMPYMTRDITLYWNTSGVPPGKYTLSANATIVDGEINTENNKFVDGNVTIKPAFAISLFIILLPFLIGIVVILLLTLLYYLKKRREAIKLTSHLIVIGRIRS